MTDFAETLFHLKKTARSAMHLIVEEAQKFIPQQHRGDTTRLLGAMEDIVRLGRNYGIGATLISQRPQSVNKEVLNQCECLVCFQTTGPQERKAMEAWVVDKGLDRSLADLLPELAVGTAYIWSPQWLGVLDTYHILAKKTYDASSTPKLGQTRKPPRKLARDELKWLEEAMAETIEEAKANDPAALKAHIRELERKLAKRPSHVVETKREKVEVPVVTPKDRKLILELRQSIDQVGGLFSSKVVVATQVVERMEATLRAVENRDKLFRPTDRLMSPEEARQLGRGVRSGRFRTDQPNQANGPKSNGEIKLVGKMRNMLAALAAVEGHELTRKQLAVMVGMAPGSGGFNNYVGALSKQGLIETGSGTVSLTDKGHAHAGGVSVASKPSEILDLWLPKVTGKSKDILRLLFDNPDHEFGRSEVAEQVGMAPGSGGFNNYVGKLSSLQLIVTGRGVMRLNREVFHL